MDYIIVFYLYQLTNIFNLLVAHTKIHSSTSDKSFAPKWIDDYTLPELKFNENSLRQMVCFFHKNVVNLYIIYKLDTYFRDLNTDFN